MSSTSKEKMVKSPHPIQSKTVFFAKGIAEKQFREQIRHSILPSYTIGGLALAIFCIAIQTERNIK